MSKFTQYLGYAWAGPVTVFGLAYAGLFGLLRWYTWVGKRGDSLVWRVSPKAPAWLLKAWSGWSGQTIGQVVVICVDPDTYPGQVTLLHESHHVMQCMRLGVLWPILYGLTWLAIKVACRNSDAYFDNPFEIDARRGSRQTVDVVGLKKRMTDRIAKG